jgi:aspartyl-tRNA synthetase
MVRWAEHIPTESVVLVTGILQKPKEEVKGASVHDVEILVQELHVMSHLTESLPFSVYEDDVPKEETHEADGINEEMEGESIADTT